MTKYLFQSIDSKRGLPFMRREGLTSTPRYPLHNGCPDIDYYPLIYQNYHSLLLVGDLFFKYFEMPGLGSQIH